MKPTIQTNISLRDENTFRIDAKASHYVAISIIEQIAYINLEKYPQHIILGGGSNILFVSDVAGLVIKNAVMGKSIIDNGDGYATIEAGGGENWHELVQWALSRGLGGIENLSLIPGTVGAAPMQNIGAYGVELEDVFVSLDAIELATGEKFTFTTEECTFGYRTSIFKTSDKDKYFIYKVRLRLSTGRHNINTEYGALREWLQRKKNNSPTIQEISEAVIDIRSSKLPDPKVLGNAGSFFKNPVLEKAKFHNLQQSYPDLPWYPVSGGNIKVPAAWLIEKCGWKGKVVGRTGTHKQQPLVLVNYGGATGAEIYNLSTRIKDDVAGTFNISLEREVNVI